MEALQSDGVELSKKQLMRYIVLKQVYEQQQYMYENQVHTVPNRIVSISQPYICPIVRGKAAAPVEFGAKLDLSIDENGMARLEKLSFDAYNESDVLIGAIERYRERTGHYPERAWRIRFTGTVIIWHTVSCMASGYPGRGSAGQRRMPWLIKT